jgi:ribonuclease PH
MARKNNRTAEMLRRINFTRDYTKYAEGSVLVEMGDTKVICNATVEEKVPPFMKGEGRGWITAEYSMLPRATGERTIRESAKGKQSGRTMEIQRLIGRSFRSVVDLSAIGERTIWIDCDVIQADGGTRTASISGGFVALVDALNYLYKQGEIDNIPIIDYLAAVSVGKVGNEVLLDLNFFEDSKAQVDMNIIMTGKGKIVEVQGTAEEYPFSKDEMFTMIEYAEKGINKIIAEQKKVLSDCSDRVGIWNPLPNRGESI